MRRPIIYSNKPEEIEMIKKLWATETENAIIKCPDCLGADGIHLRLSCTE